MKSERKKYTHSHLTTQTLNERFIFMCAINEKNNWAKKHQRRQKRGMSFFPENDI